MTESINERGDTNANSKLHDVDGESQAVEAEVAGMDAKVLLGDATKIESATPGGFLRQERERQERTLQQVADELHLSKQSIEAIEANRYTEFGAPVFAKGHLRRYAIFLGLSPEDVLTRYDQLSDSARAHESIPPAARSHEPSRRVELNREATGLRIAPRSSGQGVRWFPLLLGVLLIGAVVAAGWWWYSTRGPAATAQTESNTVAVRVDTSELPDAAEEDTVSTAVPPTAALPAAAAPPVVASPPPAAGSPVAGKVRVRLVFNQDSWAEVYDGRGNRMMYDVGRTDLPRLIDADPPVRVVLGYSPAVRVEINGVPVTIPERHINNSVARFAVQADGRVQ